MSGDVSSSVLIVEGDAAGDDGSGDDGDTEPDTNLQQFLEDDGYTVTLATTLPADLSSYGSIWYVGLDAVSSANQQSLEGFVEAGGGLYLTGERPCCQDLNDSDQEIVQTLTSDPHIEVGDGNDIDSPTAPEAVNANAPGGITSVPDPVSSWTPSAPGVISGISPEQTISEGYEDGASVATGAAWDSSLIDGDDGRLVVMMDINWLETEWWNETQAGDLVDDIENFLTAGEVSPGAATGTGAEYVALGDSYSSGEGNPPFVSSSRQDGCDQSESGSYPEIVASSLGLSQPQQFDFAACSGDTTQQMSSGQESDLGTNTRLVTLTIGGDDIDVVGIATACVVFGCGPAGLAPLGPVRHVKGNIANLGRTLREAYQHIRDLAPNAAIYVLGYPDPFSPTGADDDGCLSRDHLGVADVEWLSGFEGELNDEIETSAAEANVNFVDPNEPGAPYSFLAHDMCSNSSWFHGLFAELNPFDNGGHSYGYSFHPTVAGQAALAQAVLAQGVGLIRFPRGRAAAAIATHQYARSPELRRSADANDPGDATISGLVSGGGGPLGGVVVNLYDSGDRFVTSTTTGADGTYEFSGLDGGTYEVGFDPAGQNYVAGYYNGEESFSGADPVQLPAGGSDSNIDGDLAAGATLSGSVTDTSDQPLSGIEVHVQAADGSSTFTTTTASDGSYTVPGLAAGSYTVDFDSSGQNYVSEFYDSESSLGKADEVTLTAGATTGDIDAELSPGGSVSGTVTDSGGNPVAGVQVHVETTDGSGDGGVAMTGTDGTYAVKGLPAGSYAVDFDPDGTPYVEQFATGEPSLAEANQINVATGAAVSNIDATMVSTGEISGTVTDAAGDPEAGVTVYAAPADGSGAGGLATTAADGTYQISDLTPGSYTLDFDPGSDGLQEQLYDDEPATGTPDQVSVAAGQDMGSIDASLAAGASISGIVTDASGSPVGGVTVIATAADGSGGAAVSAIDGTYTIPGLPADGYTLEFDPIGLDYNALFYPDSPYAAGASAVTVSEGQAQTGIDASLSTAGSISGTVVDSGGAPAADVAVEALSSDCSTVANGGVTDSSGDYSIVGLPAGSYVVEFNPDGGSYGTSEYAQDVTVTAGAATPAIDGTVNAPSSGSDNAPTACVPHPSTATAPSGTTATSPTTTETTTTSTSPVTTTGVTTTTTTTTRPGYAVVSTVRASVRRDVATLTLRCTGTRTTCKVRVALTALVRVPDERRFGGTPYWRRLPSGKGTTKTVTLASATVVIPAGHERTIKLTLDRYGQALLRRRHTLHVTVVLTRGAEIGLRVRGRPPVLTFAEGRVVSMWHRFAEETSRREPSTVALPEVHVVMTGGQGTQQPFTQDVRLENGDR